MSPVTLDDLKRDLRRLGYPTLLDGVDLSHARETALAQLDWEYEASDQTPADHVRRNRARSILERFAWSEAPIHAALRTVFAQVVKLTTKRPGRLMHLESVDEDAGTVTLRRGKKLHREPSKGRKT